MAGGARAGSISYSITDLGNLGGTYVVSGFGTAINNSGQVTGFANIAGGFQHAFVFSNGQSQMTDLNTALDAVAAGQGMDTE